MLNPLGICNDYMGLLTILKDLDKEFTKDIIAKLLENVMMGNKPKVHLDCIAEKSCAFQSSYGTRGSYCSREVTISNLRE